MLAVAVFVIVLALIVVGKVLLKSFLNRTHFFVISHPAMHENNQVDVLFALLLMFLIFSF